MRLKIAVTGVLAALVALGIWTVTTTPAAGPEFHCTATSANCVLSGESTAVNLIELAGSEIECNLQLSGTEAKTATTVTLQPTYSGCKTIGMAFTASTNGCTYRFKLVSAKQATTDILCPAGKTITIVEPALACTTTVGEQTGKSTVLLENTGGAEPTELNVEFKLKELKYTASGGCVKVGSFGDGMIVGKARIGGYEDKEGSKGTRVGFHVF